MTGSAPRPPTPKGGSQKIPWLPRNLPQQAALLAIWVPEGWAELSEQEYLGLLGQRIQQMYQEAGQPRAELEEALSELGDPLTWADQRLKPEWVGYKIVTEALMVREILLPLVGQVEFPVKVKPVEEAREVLGQTDLWTWVSELLYRAEGGDHLT